MDHRHSRSETDFLAKAGGVLGNTCFFRMILERLDILMIMLANYIIATSSCICQHQALPKYWPSCVFWCSKHPCARTLEVDWSAKLATRCGDLRIPPFQELQRSPVTFDLCSINHQLCCFGTGVTLASNRSVAPFLNGGLRLRNCDNRDQAENS